MTERVEGQRDPMPEGPDLIPINAGDRLDVRFRPQWLHGEDGVIRSSIYVAVRGNDKQAWRGDAFSMGTHHHIRPIAGAQDQIPILVGGSQTPLEATLDIMRDGDRFRQVLCDAEHDDNAGNGITDDNLADIATQIEAADIQNPLAA